MNKGIILAGNMLVDALKDVDVYPEHSKLTSIRRVSRALGGLLCNCALDIAALDREIPITAVGVVGDDDYGHLILDTLGKKKNISLENVKITGATSFTDVMCDMTNRTRTFFTFRGASSELTPADFDFDKLEGDILHIGYILLLDGLDAKDDEYGTAMARVLADAQAHGIATSIDVVSEESDRYKDIVVPALKYTDYCVINETEAQRITGLPLTREDGNIDPDMVGKVISALRELGVGRWIVIHSRNESYGADTDGSLVRVPSINIPRSIIAGTTGAGDAFASGILYGAYREMSLEEAMRFATACATSSLLTPGASDGILTYEQTLAFGEDYLSKYGEVPV